MNIPEKYTRDFDYSSVKQQSKATDVKKALDFIGVYYETEKSFDDLRYIHKLRFDYWVPQHNILIEFDGQHHYYSIEHFNTKFEDVRLMDNAKNKYCEKNDIHLIRIPFWYTPKMIINKLKKDINTHSHEMFDNLKDIDEFLNLSLSHTVDIGKLYDEYIIMRESIDNRDKSKIINVDFDLFKNYVIDKLQLERKGLVKINKGAKPKFAELWINPNVETEKEDKDIEKIIEDELLNEYLNILSNNLIFNFKLLPVSHLYDGYIKYINNNYKNTNYHILHQGFFMKKIIEYFQNEDFTLYSGLSPRRRKSFFEDYYNEKIINKLFNVDNMRNNVSRYFERKITYNIREHISHIRDAFDAYYIIKNLASKYNNDNVLNKLTYQYDKLIDSSYTKDDKLTFCIEIDKIREEYIGEN